KPAYPTGARYAVWGTLDSLNDKGISAENDQYRGAIAVFGPIRHYLARLSTQRTLPVPLSDSLQAGGADRQICGDFLRFYIKISARRLHGRVGADVARCRNVG